MNEIAASAGGEALGADVAEAVLARNYWGVLGTVEAAGPYAVPVIYGWDGEALYVLMRAGRKATNLHARGAASLLVVEREGGVPARSVLVLGAVEWVRDMGGMMHAANVVRRQMAGRRQPSVRDVARLLHASIARLVPAEVSGCRHQAAAPGAPPGPQ
jgi:nitroimidazol reductase NimA-like FMN-containing flavoprotein (pyridoxamine 5'-phosphate oxidase superfamily)